MGLNLNVAISYCRRKQKQSMVSQYCTGNTKLQLRVLCLTEIKNIVKKNYSLQQFLKTEIKLL